MTLLRVEGNDGSLWLDWSTPQAKPVLTPGLASLVNHALSDETAHVGDSLGQSNVTEIGRPAGLKLGQTNERHSTGGQSGTHLTRRGRVGRFRGVVLLPWAGGWDRARPPASYRLCCGMR